TGNDNISAVYDSAIMNGSGKNNIASHQAVNPDVRGWLRIPGTNINHPVLYDNRILSENGKNVHYYIDRDLYKRVSQNGAIYADPAVQFGKSGEISRNTVLYGHNWTNYTTTVWVGRSSDVMLAQLVSYHYLNFAKSHPYLYYSTEDAEMTWVVFATFYTDVNFNYITANPNDETFANIVRGAVARSRNLFDVEVSNSDKILTLSTCTRMYGPSNRQRFVVMARLLRADEDISKAISVTANPNPVLPVL
ncbi:MAG: class B sortase, partial [Oscillospiraceae bacterium]